MPYTCGECDQRASSIFWQGAEAWHMTTADDDIVPIVQRRAASTARLLCRQHEQAFIAELTA